MLLLDKKVLESPDKCEPQNKGYEIVLGELLEG
jgi:hypothetical protein